MRFSLKVDLMIVSMRVMHMDTEYTVYWLCGQTGVKEALKELPPRGPGQAELRAPGAGWRSRRPERASEPFEKNTATNTKVPRKHTGNFCNLHDPHTKSHPVALH